jgi:hypothetical protein
MFQDAAFFNTHSIRNRKVVGLNPMMAPLFSIGYGHLKGARFVLLSRGPVQTSLGKLKMPGFSIKSSFAKLRNDSDYLPDAANARQSCCL